MKISILTSLILSLSLINPLSVLKSSAMVSQNTLTTSNYNPINVSTPLDTVLALDEDDFIIKTSLPNNFPIEVDTIKSIKLSDQSLSYDIEKDYIILSGFENDRTYQNLSMTVIDKNDIPFIFVLSDFYIPQKSIESLDVKTSSYKNNYIGEVSLPEDIVPISSKISDKDVVVDTVDGRITLIELKPQTTYENLLLSLKDVNGKKHYFKLNTFSTINKNFSYINAEIIRYNDMINAKLGLPEDLKAVNAKISDSDIKFQILDNNLYLVNLSKDKFYDNLKVIVKDDKGKLHNFIVNKFSTFFPDVNLEQLSLYIENAYKKAFNRMNLDSDGFFFWFLELSKHKVGARDFILNILDSDEFIKNTKDAEDKINKIYGVMFKRTPDANGLNFWITKLNNYLLKTEDEKTSVSNVVKEMAQTEEFKNIVSELGIKY